MTNNSHRPTSPLSIEDKDKAQDKHQDKAKVSTFFINAIVSRLQSAALLEEWEDESDFSAAK